MTKWKIYSLSLAATIVTLLILIDICTSHVAYAGTISVSGTLFDSDTVTPFTSESINVALRVNGGSPLTASTSVADGTFSFGNVSANADDVLTLYAYGADDSAPGDVYGNTVTKTDGSTNITNLPLSNTTVTVLSNDGSVPTTVADLLAYTSDQNINNMLFAATTTSSGYVFDVSSDALFYVPAGNTFQPGADVETDGGIWLQGTWRNTGVEFIVDNGGWDSGGSPKDSTTGQFIAASSTFELDGFNTVDEFYGNPTFYDFILADTFLNIHSDTITVLNEFRSAPWPNAIVDAPQPCTINVSGTINDSGLGYYTKRVKIVVAGNTDRTIFVDSVGYLGSLEIASQAQITLNPLNDGTLRLTGTLTVDSGATLDLAGTNLTGTSSDTVFTNNGTVKLRGSEVFTDASVVNATNSRVVYYGDNTATTSLFSTSFYNLEATSSTSTGKTLVFPANQTTTIAGQFVAQGIASSSVVIKSDAAGTDGQKTGHQAVLNIASVGAIDYLTVYDSDAEGAASPLSATNSSDGGNNTNWNSLNPLPLPPSPPPPPPPGGGGSVVTSSGGGGGGGGSVVNLLASSTAALSSTTPASSCQAGQLFNPLSGKPCVSVVPAPAACLPGYTFNPVTGAACSVVSSKFTRNLSLGSSGSDVKALQQYLNTHGFPIAKTGTGSLGHESTYFGSLTKSALAKYQAANGISPATGYLESKTMAFINAAAPVATTGTLCPNGNTLASNCLTTTTPAVTSCQAGQLFNSQTGRPCTSGTAAPAACLPGYTFNPVTGAACSVVSSKFTRNLSLGSSGSDVKALQQYLNTHGFPIAKTGTGSLGHESTYFGSLTKNALKAFQAKLGITKTSTDPEYGILGVKTRSYLATH